MSNYGRGHDGPETPRSEIHRELRHKHTPDSIKEQYRADARRQGMTDSEIKDMETD